METDQTTIPQPVVFKPFKKNQDVKEDYTDLLELMTRGLRLVHHMNLNYRHISRNTNTIRSKDLHTPLDKLKLIDSLSIFFCQVDLHNNTILQNISMKLKFLPSLRNLELRFYYSNWVSLEGVKHLASALAQLKSIKKLSLNFIYCEWVNDDSLHLVLQSLKKNKNLQSLTLDIARCKNVNEKSFKRLASIFKHSLKALKELSLGFASLDLPKGKPLDFLASGLSCLKDLQKLSIDFSNLKVPLQGFDFPFFMSSIKNITSLKILSLDFSYLYISLSVLKRLVLSFPSLINLHTLALNFRSSSVLLGQEMEVLSQGLQLLASSLKSLTLDFRDSQNLNDQALEKLSAGLKTLTNLSGITLQCQNCVYLWNAGAESVINALGSLPNLDSAVLGFRASCRPIINTFYETVEARRNLRNLPFNANNCE